MRKVIATSVLAFGLLVSITSACPAGPVQKSPVQAPPAPPAAARADGGYRTYSYEPGDYRSYGRARGLRKPPYLDARSKALGW